MADYDVVLQSIADALAASAAATPPLADVNQKRLIYLQVLSKFKTDFWNVTTSTFSEYNTDGTTTEKTSYFQISSQGAKLSEVTENFKSKVDAIYNNIQYWLNTSDIFDETGIENALQFNEYLLRITEEVVQSEKQELHITEQRRNNNLLAEQDEILYVIRDDIHRLRERGDDTHLGIVHRGIHWEAEDCKNRTGIMRMALKDSDLLDDFARARAEEDYSKVFTDCGV